MGVVSLYGVHFHCLSNSFLAITQSQDLCAELDFYSFRWYLFCDHAVSAPAAAPEYFITSQPFPISSAGWIPGDHRQTAILATAELFTPEFHGLVDFFAEPGHVFFCFSKMLCVTKRAEIFYLDHAGRGNYRSLIWSYPGSNSHTRRLVGRLLWIR